MKICFFINSLTIFNIYIYIYISLLASLYMVLKRVFKQKKQSTIYRASNENPCEKASNPE